MDNTGGGTAALAASSLLGASPWFGLSFSLPEADPVCGPGKYQVTALLLPLSLNGTLPSGQLPLTALLYAANPATGAPLTNGSYYRVYFAAPGPVSSTPAYYTVSLPGSWSIDATTQRWYSLVLYTTGGYAANWHATAGGAPTAGLATPAGAWTSSDSGASWVSAAAWPGIDIVAQKSACSPTPTQTQSGTPSQTQTQSGTGSGTPSQSQTISPTPSQSQSPTPSVSLTGPTFIDGTGALGYAIIGGAASAINGSRWAAISFAVNESDAGCGPGRWSLTQLWAPLSQVAGGAASVVIQVQLFTADVSSRGGRGLV